MGGTGSGRYPPKEPREVTRVETTTKTTTVKPLDKDDPGPALSVLAKRDDLTHDGSSGRASCPPR